MTSFPLQTTWCLAGPRSPGTGPATRQNPVSEWFGVPGAVPGWTAVVFGVGAAIPRYLEPEDKAVILRKVKKMLRHEPSQPGTLPDSTKGIRHGLLLASMWADRQLKKTCASIEHEGPETNTILQSCVLACSGMHINSQSHIDILRLQKSGPTRG